MAKKMDNAIVEEFGRNNGNGQRNSNGSAGKGISYGNIGDGKRS